MHREDRQMPYRWGDSGCHPLSTDFRSACAHLLASGSLSLSDLLRLLFFVCWNFWGAPGGDTISSFLDPLQEDRKKRKYKFSFSTREEGGRRQRATSFFFYSGFRYNPNRNLVYGDIKVVSVGVVCSN